MVDKLSRLLVVQKNLISVVYSGPWEKEKLNFDFFDPSSLLTIHYLPVWWILILLNVSINVPEIPFCCAVQDAVWTKICKSRSRRKAFGKRQHSSRGLSDCDTFAIWYWPDFFDSYLKQMEQSELFLDRNTEVWLCFAIEDKITKKLTMYLMTLS